MRLKSIEVTGFKSFPSQTALQFNAPITAIVGPNGSGKSNIAEAFRFVLGEQSMKSMRGTRGDDMIFNGTERRGRMNRAQVRITLDNTDRLLDIDFGEVVLERVVYRDGKHEYSINGSRVRLKDVRGLIAGAHIGASGHHIISQGEADKIVDANPDERKIMIEDALGLRVYQNRRRESEQKLNRTAQNIAETTALRREIAPRLQYLTRQYNKIEKVREMRAEITKLYREYFAREAMIIDEQEHEITNERGPLEGQKAELEEERERVRQEVEQTSQESEEQTRANIRLRDMDDELASIDASVLQVSQAIGRLEGEINSHQRIITGAENAAAENARRTVYLSHVEDTFQYVEEQIDEAVADGSIDRARDVFEKIRRSIREFVSANRSARDDAAVNDARSQIEKLEQEKAKREQAKRRFEQRKQALNDEYQKVSGTLAMRKSSNQEAQRRIYEIRAELTNVVNQLEKCDARRNALERRRERFLTEVKRAGDLIGHTALDYKQHTPQREDGTALIPREVCMEDRERSGEEQALRFKDIERIAIRIEDNQVTGADEIIREHTDLTERDAFLERELHDLERSAASLQELINELDETLEREFRQGLEHINAEFQELFKRMFGGGTAKLRRVMVSSSDDDVHEIESDSGGNESASKKDVPEGVELYVNPPQKKIRGLQMLSGGERSLVSIALLFAMSRINPPPFIILDETDAALDEANAKKYGDLVEHLAEHSQLVLITHNRETMSRAGVLYGVTMAGTGASRVLSVAFEQAEKQVA